MATKYFFTNTMCNVKKCIHPRKLMRLLKKPLKNLHLKSLQLGNTYCSLYSRSLSSAGINRLVGGYLRGLVPASCIKIQ